jgi:hypothetical protein
MAAKRDVIGKLEWFESEDGVLRVSVVDRFLVVSLDGLARVPSGYVLANFADTIKLFARTYTVLLDLSAIRTSRATCSTCWTSSPRSVQRS